MYQFEITINSASNDSPEIIDGLKETIVAESPEKAMAEAQEMVKRLDPSLPWSIWIKVPEELRANYPIKGDIIQTETSRPSSENSQKDE